MSKYRVRMARNNDEEVTIKGNSMEEAAVMFAERQEFNSAIWMYVTAVNPKGILESGTRKFFVAKDNDGDFITGEVLE